MSSISRHPADAVPVRGVRYVPRGKVRDWNFIVLKIAGEGLDGEIQQALDDLDRRGTSKDAYITVRAEQNGTLTDYAVTAEPGRSGHLAPMQGGARGRSTRREPMLAENSMQSFLLHAIEKYPARHYFISLEGHSHQVRQVIGAVHAALVAATKAIGHKVDVLNFDSCFMAQIETATEFRGVANVLLASEESVEDWRRVESLARKAPMTPRQLAAAVVSASQEFTFSAMDLSKTKQVNRRIAEFGRTIRAIHDPDDLATLRELAKGSQHYYTEGKTAPNPFRNTLDIVDFVSRVQHNGHLVKTYPALAAACRSVRKALDVRPRGFVMNEKHKNKVEVSPELDYLDARRSHGVSMWLPTTPAPLRNEYCHFQRSAFDRETGWDKTIAHLTASRDPAYLAESMKEYEEGNKLAALGEKLEKKAEAEEAAEERAERRRHHWRHR